MNTKKDPPMRTTPKKIIKLKTSELPEKISFKYIFSEDYNPIYVNGAYGGLTSHREIVVNFFFERNGLPYSQTQKVNKDGTLGPPEATKPEDNDTSFVRVIETGIIMNIDTAKKIRDWLDEKINNLEVFPNATTISSPKSR